MDRTDTSVTQLNVCNTYTSCAITIVRTPFYWAWCNSDISTLVLINAIHQSDDYSDAITYNNNTPIHRLMDVSLGRLGLTPCVIRLLIPWCNPWTGTILHQQSENSIANPYLFCNKPSIYLKILHPFPIISVILGFRMLVTIHVCSSPCLTGFYLAHNTWWKILGNTYVGHWVESRRLHWLKPLIGAQCIAKPVEEGI